MPTPKEIRRRHHFVSKALVAQWIRGKNAHLCLADKDDRRLAQASPRDVFVGRHLYSVQGDDGRDDWLEREWEKIETEYLPGVARFRSGIVDPSSEHSVKIIMALHLARSRLLDDFRQIQTQERVSAMVEASPSRTHLLTAYEEQYGVLPTAEEVRTAIAGYAAGVVATNALDVELVVHSFNSGARHLDKYFVQRVEIEQFSTVRLFMGDSPVVVSQRGRVSAVDKPVAVGDADEVFMPLGPTVAAALSVRRVPHKRRLSPVEARRLNDYTVQAAKRHFIARSPSDIGASLGRSWAEQMEPTARV